MYIILIIIIMSIYWFSAPNLKLHLSAYGNITEIKVTSSSTHTNPYDTNTRPTHTGRLNNN